MVDLKTIFRKAFSFLYALEDGTTLGATTAASAFLLTGGGIWAAIFVGVFTFLMISITNYYFQGRMIRNKELVNHEDREAEEERLPYYTRFLSKKPLHLLQRYGFMVTACTVDYLNLYFAFSAVKAWIGNFSENEPSAVLVFLNPTDIAGLTAYYVLINFPFNFSTGIQETVHAIDESWGHAAATIFPPSLMGCLRPLYFPNYVRIVGSFGHTLEHSAAITLISPKWIKNLLASSSNLPATVLIGGAIMTTLGVVFMQTFLFEGSAVEKNLRALLMISNNEEDIEEGVEISDGCQVFGDKVLMLGALAHGADTLFDMTKTAHYFGLPGPYLFGATAATVSTAGNFLTEVRGARDELKTKSREGKPLLSQVSIQSQGR